MNPPYARMMADLGILVMQRREGRTFTVPGVPPDWFRSFVNDPISPDIVFEPGQIFPFVDHFLDDAEPVWAAKDGTELKSGHWAETGPEGDDLYFQAIASNAEGADYLLIRNLVSNGAHIQNAFQVGRELSLAHEQLAAEIGKKEILLHCVIHDMSGPLQGMTSALEILRMSDQTAQSAQFIELGLLAAKQQSNLIDDLLDIYRSDVSAMEAISTDRQNAPDVLACADEVLEMLLPAYSQRRVTGLVVPALNGAPLFVVAEKSRLLRVFYNLLQNAMRHSPRGTSVTISSREEGEFVRIAIEDRGSGIPPEVIPQLFQKFIRRGKGGGKAGLGLYFCRITVEQWGGSIGCEPRTGGGTTFWFRLKRI